VKFYDVFEDKDNVYILMEVLVDFCLSQAPWLLRHVLQYWYREALIHAGLPEHDDVGACQAQEAVVRVRHTSLHAPNGTYSPLIPRQQNSHCQLS